LIRLCLITVLFSLISISETSGLADEKGLPVKAQLIGNIKDAESNLPIPGATVLLVGRYGGAITDSAGTFVIDKLRPGNYSLQISHIGYESISLENITFQGDMDFVLPDIKLKRKLHSIKGITVTPSRFSIMGGEPTVHQTLTHQEIATVPQVGDDFFRAVSRLPGVGSNDFSTRITVRGGEFDELLVTLDGLQIYEPFHLKDLDGGAISIIDVAAIDGIDLMTGGFPAEYGNKMSGVFNIKSRQVDMGQCRLSAGLSLLNIKALGEGNFDNNKGSWLFSIRRGYMDYALKIAGKDDWLKPTYYDLFGKISYNLGQNHALSAMFLHAGDKLRYQGEGSYEGDSLFTKYGNTYAWLNLRSTPFPRLATVTIISSGIVQHDRRGIMTQPLSPSDNYSVDDKIKYRFLGFKTDWEFEESDFSLINIGFEYKKMWSDYNYLTEEYIFSPFLIEFDKAGTSMSGYLSNRIQLANRLITEIGLRFDHISYSGDCLASPRLNAIYNIGDKTSLRAGWGYFYQSEEIDDIYIGWGETDFFSAEKAEHLVISLQHDLGIGLNLRLEGYYKKYSNLRPDPRDISYDLEPFPEFAPSQTIFYRATLVSKGIELYLKKEMTDEFSWWLSYSLTSAKDSLDYIYVSDMNERVYYNRVLPSPTDQRHTVYLDISYHPNYSWQFNFAWQYHTGWPFTDMNESYHGGYVYWRQGDFLSSRYKPYSRIDLRINRYFNIGKGRMTVFIELINALGNKNIRSYNYNRIETNQVYYLEKEPEYWLGRIPSIGISYQIDF